jgi:outer membrane lipoprotein-sorting protein
MKKIITLAMLVVLGVVTSTAQETSKKLKATNTKVATAKVNGAGMVFVSETIDYGTVAYNSDGKREFVFTNNGNKPLIITNAQGSCGCTVPTYPKEPIAPGAKGVIGVKYDTSRGGQAFTKTVTLTTNAVVPNKTLTIKGNVLAAEPSKS